MSRCATQPQSQHHVPIDIDLDFFFPQGDGGGLNGYSQTGSLWPATNSDCCLDFLSLLTSREESISSLCADLTQLADHRQGIRQAATDTPTTQIDIAGSLVPAMSICASSLRANVCRYHFSSLTGCPTWLSGSGEGCVWTWMEKTEEAGVSDCAHGGCVVLHIGTKPPERAQLDTSGL